MGKTEHDLKIKKIILLELPYFIKMTITCFLCSTGEMLIHDNLEGIQNYFNNNLD